jgi:hypothetical protein
MTAVAMPGTHAAICPSALCHNCAHQDRSPQRGCGGVLHRLPGLHGRSGPAQHDGQDYGQVGMDGLSLVIVRICSITDTCATLELMEVGAIRQAVCRYGAPPPPPVGHRFDRLELR